MRACTASRSATGTGTGSASAASGATSSPHYWSTLTANVLLRLPEELRTSETDRLAGAILRANMANYFPDGSATCAFVMPSSVDGAPAHSADPLANDQDFHLAIWMQVEEDGYAVTG